MPGKINNLVHYIYKITNLVNHKIYIGQARDLNKRWQAHKINVKPLTLIDKTIKKYGSNNFIYEVLETCQTQEEANYQEIWYIFIYCSHVSTKQGYNIEFGGKNSPCSEEKKQAISKAKKGKYAGVDGCFYGKKHSQESLNKMSESHKGNKSKLGQKHSPETIAKLSAARMGKVSWNKGKPRTEQEKQAIIAGRQRAAERRATSVPADSSRVVKHPADVAPEQVFSLDVCPLTCQTQDRSKS